MEAGSHEGYNDPGDRLESLREESVNPMAENKQEVLSGKPHGRSKVGAQYSIAFVPTSLSEVKVFFVRAI